jgi:hypothetical protein
MSNYQAAARTNYFRCKDILTLKADLRALGLSDAILVSERGPEGMIMLRSETEACDWPTCTGDGRDDDDDNEIEVADFDIVDFLVPHLAHDEVAVVMEVGFNGISDLVGWSQAVSAQGKQVMVSLTDIYDHAHEALGVRPRSVF